MVVIKVNALYISVYVTVELKLLFVQTAFGDEGKAKGL